MRASSVLASMRHAGAASLEALLIALLLGMLVAGHAAVSGNGTSALAGNTATLTVPNGSYGATTTATLGGAATLTARSSSTATTYWVAAKCYQGGTRVYSEWVVADAAGNAVLTLGPTELWVGGAASCTAEAGYYGSNYKWRKVASTTFEVAG